MRQLLCQWHVGEAAKKKVFQHIKDAREREQVCGELFHLIYEEAPVPVIDPMRWAKGRVDAFLARLRACHHNSFANYFEKQWATGNKHGK